MAGTPEIATPREVVVNRPAVPMPEAKITLLAVGINKYKDPKIGNLEGPVADAQAVLESLRTHTKGLYVVESANLLTEKNVTPAKWHPALEQIKDRLKKTAKPDDLVVLFLAGRDVRSEIGEVLLPRLRVPAAGLPRREVLGLHFRGTISACWPNPCRKLALLDTCHSGAIQPTSTDAKTAVRRIAGRGDLHRHGGHRRPVVD